MPSYHTNKQTDGGDPFLVKDVLPPRSTLVGAVKALAAWATRNGYNFSIKLDVENGGAYASITYGGTISGEIYTIEERII